MSNAIRSETFKNKIDPVDGLLDHFASTFSGRIVERRRDFGTLKYYSYTVAEVDDPREMICGHGFSRDQKLALVKAIAEFYERKTMIEFFGSNTIVPKSFQTSNGWAVHFDQNTAAKKAYVEALERHILLATYLKFGWSGFIEINRQTTAGFQCSSLVSRMICNGYRAGILIAKPDNVPGVSFGYLCDRGDAIFTSSCWEHALYEAVEYVNCIQESKPQSPPIRSLEEDAHYFLNSTWEWPAFAPSTSSSIEIPNATPKIARIPVHSGGSTYLHGAYAFGSGLIPLFFKKDLGIVELETLASLLQKLGLPSVVPERHPVL